MSDNNEKIVVEVDGSSAEAGFNRIETAAKKADDAIDGVGKAADKVGGNLGNIASAAGRAADALAKTVPAADDAGKKIKDAGDAADKASLSFEKLQKSLFGGAKGAGAWLWDIAVEGFRSAIGFAQSFIEHIAAVQRTMSLLSAIPGTNVAKEFEYLITVANKYGLSLEQIQTNYARFVLSAQNSTLSNEQVKRSFEQIAMTVRTLHMNSQQAQFTFLALEEMMSKGQISMQQLNRQFAIRIPGAMEAIAREIGVTTPVLVEFITKVGAASDKMMPQITNALQRMFGGGIQNASQALDAEVNRLSTSVSKFFLAVLQAGGDRGMAELLRTLNSLLQTDTIATVFAGAMNRITGYITDFLRSLKPEDIEKFATKALTFLENFAKLAMMAANAVVFLSQHITAFATALGVFMGATAGAAFGPWGAAIGAIGGGVMANIGARKLGESGFDMRGNEQKLSDNDVQIAKLTQQINNPTLFERFGQIGYPTGIRSPKNLKAQLQALQAENLGIKQAMSALATSTFRDQENANRSGIYLPDLGPMMTGTRAEQEKRLKAMYGSKDGPNKKTAEERFAERQNNFLQDLLAKAEAIMSPEEDRYQEKLSKATRPVSEGGLGMDGSRMVKDRDGRSYSIDQLIKIMQDKYNFDKQAESDRKTQGKDRQRDEMTNATDTEFAKFADTYNIGNLQQVDDQTWATKARKMSTELDKVLLEEAKKMKDRAKISETYSMLHPNIDGEIDALRQQGNAYINEFKRIEQEKQTVMGGTKEFLKEWNASANDFGAITKGFLKGVSDGVVDMLTNMVMTGHLSFAKLTQFVLEYMAKMLIVQSITPFFNTFAGAISTGLSSMLNIGGGFDMYASPANSGLMSAYGNNLSARAGGGPVWPGENFLVGERGPEIVSFDRPGYVHPNESLKGGGGNTSVQVNVDASGVANGSGNAGLGNLGRKLSDAIRAVIVEERRPGGMLS